MKLKSTLCLLIISLILTPALLLAQHAGDYRSHNATSSEWHNPGTWQVYNGVSWVPAVNAPESSSQSITISKGDSVSLIKAASIDHVTIEKGGILSIYNLNEAVTFILNHGSEAASIEVSGKLYVSVHATLTGAGSINVLQGGLMVFRRTAVLEVPVAVANSANLIIDQDPCLRSVITNNGMIQWPTTGNLRMEGGTLINNGTFSIDAPANMFITNTSGNNSVINSSTGIIVKTNSTAALSINSKLQNNGLIKGSGQYSLNNMTGSGTISPGDEIGILSLNAQSFRNNSTKIQIDLADGSGPGTGHDRLDVIEKFNTDLSHTSLVIRDLGNVPVGTYTIMTTEGSFSGSFSSISLPDGYNPPVITTKSVTIVKYKSDPISDIVWNDFTAKKENHQVLLQWSTSKESNIESYHVERSTDSINFYTIGIVTSIGNSIALSSYSFADISPVSSSVNYYRIKSVGQNGIIKYSIVRSISLNDEDLVQITPNPVRSLLHIFITPDHGWCRFFNLSGVQVKSTILKQGMNDVNVTSLQAGVYLVNIYENDQLIQTKKIIKQ